MPAEAPAAVTPAVVERVRRLVEPALRAEVDRLGDPRMRRVAGYQLGWWNADGEPTPGGGGKAIRPVLAVLAAEAVAGDPAPGVPVAVAVELIHNFSLLHDDIMDRDVERRHRPTGWVAFGEGQAILAGNAMLVAALDVLHRAEVSAGPGRSRALPLMLDAVQRLIAGQSADLALEQRRDARLDEVLEMERGKTAALLSVALSAGAAAAGADDDVIEGFHRVGDHLGLAFQLVDDLLGVVGDPAVTGKSASSDLRAGKSSAPVVASARAEGSAAQRLRAALAAGVPETDDEVARVRALVEEAGGVAWAAAEADRRSAAALSELAELPVPHRGAVEEIAAVARYLINRDR